jgi:hypothetical protein
VPGDRHDVGVLRGDGQDPVAGVADDQGRPIPVEADALHRPRRPAAGKPG